MASLSMLSCRGARRIRLWCPRSPATGARILCRPRRWSTPLWLCSEQADSVTGNRYVAAHWDESASIDEARTASEAPIGWPDLAHAPVWPGGKP